MLRSSAEYRWDLVFKANNFVKTVGGDREFSSTQSNIGLTHCYITNKMPFKKALYRSLYKHLTCLAKTITAAQKGP